MATDIARIQREIDSLYDFRGKSVIHVGAGGGQFIDYARKARRVVAVDCDPAGIQALNEAVDRQGLNDRFEIVEGDFSEVFIRTDLVLFEFCLHEMADPYGALRQGLQLAPDVLVLDHHPDSAWAWHTCETEKARNCWRAVDSFAPVRREDFQGLQRFADLKELRAKLEPLGLEALVRLQDLPDRGEISIGMGYSAALLVR